MEFQSIVPVTSFCSLGTLLNFGSCRLQERLLARMFWFRCRFSGYYTADGRRAEEISSEALKLTVTESVRRSNMTHTRCFIWIFFSLWGKRESFILSFFFFLYFFMYLFLCFFLSFLTILHACRYNCVWSASCNKVPKSHTSEADGLVSFQWCCCT